MSDLCVQAFKHSVCGKPARLPLPHWRTSQSTHRLRVGPLQRYLPVALTEGEGPPQDSSIRCSPLVVSGPQLEVLITQILRI